MQQDQQTYLQRGFNQYFQRVPQNNGYDYNGYSQEWRDYVKKNTLPQVTTQDAATMFQGIPASNIVGGTMSSKNGNLTIDLDNGQIIYNDGAVDLFKLGGSDNNLVVNNSSNTSILST